MAQGDAPKGFRENPQRSLRLIYVNVSALIAGHHAMQFNDAWVLTQLSREVRYDIIWQRDHWQIR